MSTKKNLYFRTVLRRQNVLQNFLLDGFLAIASYPRMVIEVFLRRDFGRRYFSLATAITVAVFLILIPLIAKGVMASAGSRGNSQFWESYASWFIFLAAFLYFAWKRYREVKLYASLFDFSRFSLYSGDIHPIFRSLRINGRKPRIRTIETLLEPGLFLAAGLFLILLGQKVGILFTVCSLVYAFSYMAAYKNGDNFILDMIDEKILNEETYNGVVEGLDGDRTRGVRFHFDRPRTKAEREELYPHFFEGKSGESVTFAQ